MKRLAVAAGILILLLLLAGCINRNNPPAPSGSITTPGTPTVTPAVTAPATSEPENATSQVRYPPAILTDLKPSGSPDESTSSYILMDGATFIPGEVVSFHLFNHGPGVVTCKTKDPSYAVFPRLESGTWGSTAITAVTSSRNDALVMDVGDTTRRYNFATAGYKPGAYQLVTNCNANGRIISREFTVMQKPITLVF
jgi:hypothetical protein